MVKVFSYTNQIDIKAPARKVFAALSDPQSFVHFLPMLKAARLKPEGAMRRGSRVHIDGPRDTNSDKPIKLFVDITDFVPDRVIEFSGSMSRDPKADSNRYVTRYELQRYGEVTRLVVVTTLNRLGWWSERFFGLVKPPMRWLTDWTLRKFKAFVERSR